MTNRTAPPSIRRGRLVRPAGFRYLLLVAAMLAIWSSAGRVESGLFKKLFGKERSMVDEYNLLNRLLYMRVHSDEPALNIKAALELLAESTSGRSHVADIELPSQQAMVQFTDLINLMDPEEPLCDMIAHNILVENERATANDVLRPLDDRRALRRIEMVIYQVAYQHASQCFLEYPHKLERAISRQPKQPMKDIRQMMTAMINTSDTKVLHLPGTRDVDHRQVAAYKSKGVDVKGRSEGAALLQYLRDKSRNEQYTYCYLQVMSHPEKRATWVVYEHEVVSLIERFIYSRCEFLFDSFENILLPAQYEQKLFTDKFKYRASNNRNAEFMIWLEYYRLCKDMVTNKRKVEDSVIEAIWAELHH